MEIFGIIAGVVLLVLFLGMMYFLVAMSLILLFPESGVTKVVAGPFSLFIDLHDYIKATFFIKTKPWHLRACEETFGKGYNKEHLNSIKLFYKSYSHFKIRTEQDQKVIEELSKIKDEEEINYRLDEYNRSIIKDKLKF